LQFDVLFSIRDLQERYQQILTKVPNHETSPLIKCAWIETLVETFHRNVSLD
jgi:hypothetical protein